MRANLNDNDLNRTFTFTVKQPRKANGEAGEEITKILDAEKFSKTLLKTSGAVADGELTCMDLPLDRVLWKKIVNNNYAQPKRSRGGSSGAQGAAFSTSTNNWGASQVDISSYDTIHANLPCPHFDSQRIYGVYGYNKDIQKMGVSTRIFVSWGGVIREAMTIEKHIQMKPIILFNFSTFMNRQMLSDKLAALKSKELQMHAIQHAKHQAAVQAFHRQAELVLEEEQRQEEQEQEQKTATRRSRRLQERKENN